MDTGCLLCGGTFTSNFKPCPICCGDDKKKLRLPKYDEVPIQYQDVTFDKELLPDGLQGKYGEFMENLMKEIVNNASSFQRNTLICCRPNSGKTVWAYDLYTHLKYGGLEVPPIKDILEVRDIFNLVDKDVDMLKMFVRSRIAIVKLPRKMTADLFDYISMIVERRVRSNGCTIFLYGGTKSDLKNQDTFDKLKYITGNGSFNTVKVESFIEKRKEEES